MPHEIASVITCTLCTQKIAGPGLVIGAGQPAGRVQLFMESLTEHLAKAHAKEFEAIQQKVLEFFGLNCVMQYVTQDERVQYQRFWLRWRIHQHTLNARYSDEKIGKMSAELAGILYDEITAALLVILENAPATNLRGTFDRAGENVRAAIGARIVEIVTIVRNELQEPTEPKPPAGISVVKAG